MSDAATPLAKVTIVSGGQTGADRAALDFAIEHQLPHAGWCPRGRLAEDGSLGEQYHLRETPSRKYAERTEWNVRDSDATVVFTLEQNASGGTALTLRLAGELGKPVLHLARKADEPAGTAAAIRRAADELNRFIRQHEVVKLNVAGPRASQSPRVANFVWSVFAAALVAD